MAVVTVLARERQQDVALLDPDFSRSVAVAFVGS